MANSGPTAVVVEYDSDTGAGEWTGPDMDSTDLGARAWDDLGFLYVRKGVDDYPYEGEMVRCPRDWAQQHLTECAIPVGVTREVGLVERYGAVGLAYRDDWTIVIDARYHGEQLRSIAAHEFGHILLNTSLHLPPDQYGIMMPYLSGYDRPTKYDMAFACEATGICD